MKKWLRGSRGTVAMTLTWILGWGLGFGGLIEAFLDPHGEIVDVWLTVMAIPGFIGGVLFFALLRIWERHRGFDEVSFARLTLWGVVTGLELSGLGLWRGVGRSFGLTTAPFIAITTALAVVAALASAMFFRLVVRWTVIRRRAARA